MFKSVGKRIPKYDGIGHVTGKTTFVDDIILPGMQYIKVLRSPFHKAKINSIDTSGAEQMPGVSLVLTSKDVPNNIFGYFADETVLADGEVRYKGQPIAAVVAADEDMALEATREIKVDFEEEQFVMDPIKAMLPDAPKVRPEGNIWMVDEKMPNRKIRVGDVDKAFQEADHIVESSYRSTANEHAALETQVAVASVDYHDRLIVHTVTQGKQIHLGFIAGALQLPLNKINVKGGTIGGGFGGKHKNHADIVTALAAYKLKSSVKWRWTREEEMLCSTWRGAWFCEFKDGITKEGKIIGRKIKLIHDCGAYSELGPYALDKAVLTVAGPYSIPNVSVDGYCVYTNKTPSCAMRGFGINVGLTAEEIQMEKIATTIGMDSWELRFLNAWREGGVSSSNQKLKAVSTIEVMKEAAKLSDIKLPEKLMNMSSLQGGVS